MERQRRRTVHARLARLSGPGRIPSGFLADRWRPATGGRTFPVWNPATEEVIARVADCSAEDAITALDAAASAADDWAFTSPRERATLLHRLAELMIDDREPLARLLCLEVGRTTADARREVDYAADCVVGTPKRPSGPMGAVPSHRTVRATS